MMREKIENALLAMGIPLGINGFTYIADAVEIIDEKGRQISITKELYPSIAERNNTTPLNTERGIRYAFKIARSVKTDYETVNHYIGFTNCSNANSLMMLHMMLKREET